MVYFMTLPLSGLRQRRGSLPLRRQMRFLFERLQRAFPVARASTSRGPNMK